ncbi:ATP-binding cassette domain-containing protein [Ruoffia sp. FAM 24228]|uniref:ABC transporter ATP-binding protein n=1 Tax=Ruoffia sp. FAM 24228 TaxID=3259517 RepID=UPI00388746AA
MSELIQINNLTIKSNTQTIISNLSFDVQPNEILTINGPSGSGKSTVLKYLAQLQSPALTTSGDYLFKGEKVEDIDPIELRQKVSYCFQAPTLFGETVRDNLQFSYDIRDMDFDEELAKDLLSHVQLPKSYLDKDITTLSGGEKQRVALIRNVQFRPDILLLDEITSALDSDTRKIIWEWLNQYRKENNVTVIIVSHIKKEQQLADRIITLDKIGFDESEDNHEPA